MAAGPRRSRAATTPVCLYLTAIFFTLIPNRYFNVLAVPRDVGGVKDSKEEFDLEKYFINEDRPKGPELAVLLMKTETLSVPICLFPSI